MTGSIAIDVVLGLTFIFLLYSLLASILQEIIAHWAGLRARMLLKAIGRMLDDGNPATQFTLINFVVDAGLSIFKYFINPFTKRPIAKLFYEHPSIKYLGENSWSSKPSYLSASTFSRTLIDILRGPEFDGTQNQSDLIRSAIENNSRGLQFETLRHIRLMYVSAGGDIEKFKALLENWFNEMMERTTGWFKKQTQFILFIIGFGIAYTFNVDTIAIGHILANNEGVRTELADLAIRRYQTVYEGYQQTRSQSGDTANATIEAKDSLTSAAKAIKKSNDEIRSAIDEANSILGLGRKDTCAADCQQAKLKLKEILKDTTLSDEKRLAKTMELCEKIKMTTTLSPHQSSLGMAMVGWLLTALAISLGAPFWFDILNKVAVIRTSVKRTDDGSSEPKTPPQSPVPSITANVSPLNRIG